MNAPQGPWCSLMLKFIVQQVTVRCNFNIERAPKLGTTILCRTGVPVTFIIGPRQKRSIVYIEIESEWQQANRSSAMRGHNCNATQRSICTRPRNSKQAGNELIWKMAVGTKCLWSVFEYFFTGEPVYERFQWFLRPFRGLRGNAQFKRNKKLLRTVRLQLWCLNFVKCAHFS